MSQFEFVLVPIAIVLGFTITEILNGFGDQLRDPARRFHPLQLAATTYVLSISIRYMWLMWGVSAQNWNYFGYLAAIAPPLAYAVGARVLRFDPGSSETPEEQYLRSSRHVWLFTVLPLLLIARSIFQQPDRLLSPTGAMWLSLIATFAWLSRSTRLTHHRIGWAYIWIIHIAFTFAFQPVLDVSTR